MTTSTHSLRFATSRQIRWGGALAFAALGALAAPSARADDWATPGLDAAHDRLSAERSGARFSDGHWAFSPHAAGRALASPVVSDGFVVSADLDGTLSVLSADSGRAVWQVPLGSAVQGTPAIASGRVFVPTIGNRVVALGLADGAPLWTTDLGGMNLSSPTPISGDIIVAAGFPQRHLVRLAGSTGAVVWQSQTIMDQFSNTSPAVSGGLVVVGTNGGHYYAFDAATGVARWEYKADGVVHLAAPIIVGGRVYMAGGDDSDHVHAVDAATGAAMSGWPVSLPAPDPDLAGTRVDRHRAVSSFASVGGMLVIETRLDDALDTNSDGVADQYLSREIVVALDPSSGTLVWQHPLARAVFTDPNDVPKFFICPTPAAFGTDAGAPLLAAASSLTATVSILDVASGNDDGDLTVAGRALASPVMANGRLISVAESGVVEGQLSTVNHPPAAPILAANPHPLDAADVTLRWLPAVDPDAELPSYEVRIDSDGEVLQSYQQQLFPGQGATSIQLVAQPTAGVTYTFAVRARDPHGALSPWSAPETFTVAASGAVTVDGIPATNLRAALAAAQAGSVIMLGAGTYPLSEPLHVGAGVSIQGAGAGRTTLDGTGLAIGVSFDATDASHAAGLDKVTVAGAETCVAVNGGASGIHLTHLVVHDCATTGVKVAATGGANIANATLVGNGTGVDSAGIATIKNSLLTGNGVGLKSDAIGALVSTFDDLFGNQSDYQGLGAGTGDLSTAVMFTDLPGRKLQLAGPQPSTDKGDPADDVGAEPAPNGARINLGAFGGTADAELSASSTVVGDPGATEPTPISPPADQGGGCGLAGGPSSGGASLLLVLAMLSAAFKRRCNHRSHGPRRSEHPRETA
ncbi:MAG TPA: PQQ-binding-like beta-propeller repeat protein [Polyangia bacterium]|nr:PQQ-binding-like beta-propeller repeat protein [Polyangia bacterium]